MPDESWSVSHVDTTAARVVQVVGEADLDTAGELDTALTGEPDAARAVTVVDLSRTTFADSTILGVLLRAHARHEETGRRLVLAGPLEDVLRRLFDVTGTIHHLRFARTLDEALADQPAVD
ncbi:STAS domain-containing protein [Streptomyces sp. NPDC007088]|uniref:STAS domain-containing protein n=1 Tax=Streptomyces sp. NPDC007088 TaxID=3364773 RepID=UPI0036C93AF4